MLKQPVLIVEGMAVGVLDRGTSRSAYVREEQTRMNVFGQMQEIGIIPGRVCVAINPWRRIIAIPAHAESIAVQTFHDQRMIGAGQNITQSKRGTGISEPAAHAGIFLKLK